MKTPVRWLDDPTLAADLRADLECVQAHPWRPDLARAAATFDAVLAAEPSSSGAADPSRGQPALEAAAELGRIAAVSGSTPAVLLPKLAIATLTGSLIVAASVWHLQQPESPPAQASPDTSGPHAIVQPGPKTSSSRREIEQLKRIHATLDRDPAEAYRLARASLEEIPRGALREEREGLAVIALWQSGDHAAARALALSFLDRYPESALRERIRTLVTSETEP